MPRYKLTYKGSARRDLERLPRKLVDAITAFCEGALIENPQRVGKPLSGKYEGMHSAVRGSYRIIYEIHEHEVHVYVAYVAHRAVAYRSSR